MLPRNRPAMPTACQGTQENAAERISSDEEDGGGVPSAELQHSNAAAGDPSTPAAAAHRPRPDTAEPGQGDGPRTQCPLPQPHNSQQQPQQQRQQGPVSPTAATPGGGMSAQRRFIAMHAASLSQPARCTKVGQIRYLHCPKVLSA